VIEELAMGAIASGSVRVLNKNVVQSLRLSMQWAYGTRTSRRPVMRRYARCSNTRLNRPLQAL
jgi:predicted phosphoribosyltransferase